LNHQKNKYEQKTWLVKAINEASISDEALKKNGHKLEDITWKSEFGRQNYKLPQDVIIDIEQWINQDGMSAHDRVFAGQNPNFDLKFMVEFWKKNDSFDTFPFVYGHNNLVIDTKELALFIDICLGRKRERYNLGSLIKDYGIKKGTAHRADEDSRMTADLLIKFINGMSKSIKESFGD
jgi:DNA polymerase III alpha subunit (gram-positive type)